MNINQQSEIDELFNRVNKNLSKNPKAKIADEDLTRVRAFVVQSQRPLQAVRLLKKEREERTIDERFTQQKEDIIAKATQLDREKKQFLERQREVLATIAADKEQIKKNQAKRKEEDARLKKLNQTALEHQQTIEQLRQNIDRKKHKLDTRQKELEGLHKYTVFLEKVVSGAGNKDAGDDNQSMGIIGLRGRFINLKNENKKLNKRKNSINQRMEQVKEDEQRTLADMTKELLKKQQDMATLQYELEKIQLQNQALEQDFENEIERKNANTMQIGQIISSIANIHATCQQLAAMQKQTKQGQSATTTTQQPEATHETGHEMVGQLQFRLDEAVGKMSELTTVMDQLKSDQYTMEMYYERSAEQATRPNQAAQSSNVVMAGGNASNVGQSKTGMGKQSDFMNTSQATASVRR